MDKTKITRSALLGQAVGDAFGVPVEFLSRGAVRSVNLTEMVGCDTPMDFPSRWGNYIPAGAWSDDTSMAVAGMASIVRQGGQVDCEDVMLQFVNWWERAKYCSLETPFGLGGTVSRALRNYCAGTPAIQCGPTDIYANGNGSLMRILPFALYCIFNDLDDFDTVTIINATSAITHGHPISKMGCMIFTIFLRKLLSGQDVPSAWDSTRLFDFSAYYDAETCSAYEHLLSDGFYEAGDSYISETGYVVDTLMTAVYSMLDGHDYESSVRCAVDMGYDTDTAAAVTGALAGAYYGVESIPERWLAKLRKRPQLEALADRFAKSCG